MGPELAPLDEGAASAAAASVGMAPELARINLFGVLLRAPHVAAGINGTKDMVLRGLKLDARLRELAIMRTAWLMGAEYVWNHHTRPHVEHDLDVNPSDVLEVRDWKRSRALSDVDRAVLRLTDELVLAPDGTATEEAVSAVAELLSSDQAVEVVATVALYRGISSIARSLRIPMEAGYGRWEPDGAAPPSTVG